MVRASSRAAKPSWCFTATSDIIDQGIYGLPCKDVLLAGRHFSFAIPVINGKYEGELTADGHAIKGMWTHGEPRVLIFTRKEPETETSLDKQLNRIDAMVSETFAKRPIGSVTIGVVSQTHLVWSKSYGLADMATHTRPNKDTIYRIGSLTKMFTAVMLDQLVETGTVNLADPVSRYLPEIDLVQNKRSGTPPVTLFQLATHTSGLAREPDDVDKYTLGATADYCSTPSRTFITLPNRARASSIPTQGTRLLGLL